MDRKAETSERQIKLAANRTCVDKSAVRLDWDSRSTRKITGALRFAVTVELLARSADSSAPVCIVADSSDSLDSAAAKRFCVDNEADKVDSLYRSARNRTTVGVGA